MARSQIDIVIIGAGQQALIVTDILLAAAAAGDGARPIALLDDDVSRHGSDILGIPIVGPLSALGTIKHDGIVVAIGDNHRRREIFEKLIHAGEQAIIARHPSASIAPSAQIGAGTMISAGATVTPHAIVGRGVLLNTKSSVDHESVIGDFAHISAGATVGANVTIGEEVMMALGSTAISGSSVGARTIVGAGAVVIRDLPEDVVAFGAPARVIRART